MIKTWLKNNWIKLLSFTMYLIFSICYLINLNALNGQLKDKNYLEIVAIPQVITYFVYAAILLGIGVCYIFFIYKDLWNASKQLSTLLTSISLIIATCIVMIFIIYLIQNPILRAIFCVYVIGGAALCAVND